MAILGIAILAVLALFLLAGWLQGSAFCAVILWVPTAYWTVMIASMSSHRAAQVTLAISVLVFAAPRVLVEIGRAEARKRAAGPTIVLASPGGLRRP